MRDQQGREHRPAGTPGGGRFMTGGAQGDDQDLAGLPPAREVRAWRLKDQVERAAMAGDEQRATELARRMGAFVPGDRIPYGDYTANLFDGRILEGVAVHGSSIIALERFAPEAVHEAGDA